MHSAYAAETISDFGTTPESCAFGPKGEIYFSVTNGYDKYGDGNISAYENGKVRVLASGLNDPHGIALHGDAVYAADNRGQVWKVGMDGAVTKVADSGMFPRRVTNLNDIEVDSATGDIYVSDTGEWEGRGGVVFKISASGKIESLVSDEDDWRLISPNGLKLDGKGGLLVVDWTTGNLLRIDLASREVSKVSGGWGPSDGLALSSDGKLLISSYFKGVNVLAGLAEAKAAITMTLESLGAASAADIALSPDGKKVCIPDFDGAKVIVVDVKYGP